MDHTQLNSAGNWTTLSNAICFWAERSHCSGLLFNKNFIKSSLPHISLNIHRRSFRYGPYLRWGLNPTTNDNKHLWKSCTHHSIPLETPVLLQWSVITIGGFSTWKSCFYLIAFSRNNFDSRMKRTGSPYLKRGQVGNCLHFRIIILVRI